MSTLRLEDQDPNEVLDHVLNWETALDGDTIDSATWENFPTTLLVKTSESRTTLTHTIRLTVGTATVNSVHLFTSRVVTNGGETIDQRVKIRIRNG